MGSSASARARPVVELGSRIGLGTAPLGSLPDGPLWCGPTRWRRPSAPWPSSWPRAWSPLASGFLVDGFDPDRTAPGDLRRRLPWASGEGAERLAAVRAEAADANRSLREHAMRWAAATAHPIAGARTPDEARALATLSD